jgi:nucleotide-binding universal stress UspA family protein
MADLSQWVKSRFSVVRQCCVMKSLIASPRGSRHMRTTHHRLHGSDRKGKPLQIRKVLVPIDFSPSSLESIPFVVALLRRFGSELHLIHVSAADHPLTGTAAMPLIMPKSAVGRSVRRRLKALAENSGFEVRAKNINAVEGSPFQKICALAGKIDIDLIVISTRGNTGFKHLALGSTAERVVRYSPCPVLVVRSVHPGGNHNGNGKTPPAALQLRKILVPVDFSDCSRQGLEYAKRLAKQFRATLILLHSVYFQYHVTSDEYARYDYPLLVQEADKAARERMCELVRETESDGVKVEPLLETGHVGEQICDRARSHGADLIVTSTHGWTGFKHVLLGSTAEYVVQHARCAVLVVPTHDRSL